MDELTAAWLSGALFGVTATLLFDHFILIPAVNAWTHFLRRRGHPR